MKSIKLKQWEESTQELADYFEKRFFGSLDLESDWVADQIGGVYQIADLYFDLDDMVNYIRYSYKKDEMFKHYYYALEKATDRKTRICIRDWKKLNK